MSEVKINLVKNGIFPIIYDKNGDLLPTASETGVIGTIQGEGKLVGTPCLFIRLSGCPLRCIWFDSEGEGSPCDSWYSSHKPEKNIMTVDDIVSTLKVNLEKSGNKIKHLVISGGEPTMQDSLYYLVEEIKKALPFLHITIETLGYAVSYSLLSTVDLFSISPKLKSSMPTADKFVGELVGAIGIKHNANAEARHDRDRKNFDVLTLIINESKDYQLKFVVSEASDIEEIKNEWLEPLKSLTNKTDIDSHVMLMCEGAVSNELALKNMWVTQQAIKNGWSFTPRLHIELFGNLKYV